MISQTAEYALRAVVFLARSPDESFPARAVAEATKVPPGYMSKVLQQLARTGLVNSQRGLRGGFMLARDPGTLTMLDVIEATDTPVQRIESCPLGLPGHVRLCALHRRLDEAIAQIRDVFGSSCIGDFIDGEDGIVPLCEEPARGPAAQRPGDDAQAKAD